MLSGVPFVGRRARKKDLVRGEVASSASKPSQTSNESNESNESSELRVIYIVNMNIIL